MPPPNGTPQRSMEVFAKASPLLCAPLEGRDYAAVAAFYLSPSLSLSFPVSLSVCLLASPARGDIKANAGYMRLQIAHMVVTETERRKKKTKGDRKETREGDSSPRKPQLCSASLKGRLCCVIE